MSNYPRTRPHHLPKTTNPSHCWQTEQNHTEQAKPQEDPGALELTSPSRESSFSHTWRETAEGRAESGALPPSRSPGCRWEARKPSTPDPGIGWGGVGWYRAGAHHGRQSDALVPLRVGRLLQDLAAQLWHRGQGHERSQGLQVHQKQCVQVWMHRQSPTEGFPHSWEVRRGGESCPDTTGLLPSAWILPNPSSNFHCCYNRWVRGRGLSGFPKGPCRLRFRSPATLADHKC